MKGDQRKKQIMMTALELFAEKGYQSTSVADIVEELGVARGTFYRYFDDKYDLFDQLLEVNFRYIRNILPTVPVSQAMSSSDLENILSRVFIQLLEQPESRDFMSMMVEGAPRADAALASKVASFYDDLAEMFSGFVSRFQETGLIDKRDPLALSYLIMGALREIFIQWARGEKFKDLESLIHETAAFIVYGVKAGERIERNPD